jgi:hypothetical protein
MNSKSANDYNAAFLKKLLLFSSSHLGELKQGVHKKFIPLLDMAKTLLLGMCVAAGLLGLQSCKNNLNTLAPYKDIPVVYGLLDQNDTIHYIRINKAFQTSGNAFTAAQVYDSTNYPVGTISVQLQDYNSNGTLVKTLTLDTTTAIPMPAGTFSSPYQVLYYTKAALNANDQYNLVVTNEKTNKTLTGSTYLISDVSLNGLGFGYNFVLTWAANSLATISWSQTTNAAIYQMTFRFNYREVIGSDTTKKYIDWVFPAESNTDSANYSLGYSGLGFLQFVKGSIPVIAGAVRFADTVDIMFTSGTQDFLTYMNLSLPSLTVNQDRPYYTDVKGGVGIFTARHTQVYKKVLSYASQDTLATNPLTSPLGFQP